MTDEAPGPAAPGPSIPGSPEDDSPYLALAEVGDDARWAFGGGFDDPLEGVDTRVPAELDPVALAAVCLALGDESLLLAQTLQRWCTHAPELEEEVAIANIALDLIGQTRLLYARAAAAHPDLVPELPPGSPVPVEDRLAFFRDAAEFRVSALAVMPDADFAGLVLRLAAIATWRDVLWRELRGAPDPVLAAVAERAVAEVDYHRDLATRWVQVLAGGTPESADRLAAAHAAVAPHVDGLAEPAAGTTGAPVWADAWSRAAEAFTEAWSGVSAGPAGAAGSTDMTGAAEPVGSPSATEAQGWRDDLVGELQSVARQHPEGRW